MPSIIETLYEFRCIQNAVFEILVKTSKIQIKIGDIYLYEYRRDLRAGKPLVEAEHPVEEVQTFQKNEITQGENDVSLENKTEAEKCLDESAEVPIELEQESEVYSETEKTEMAAASEDESTELVEVKIQISIVPY